MRQVESWIGYLTACRDLPMNAPACMPFWYWAMVASLAIGAGLIIWVAWRYIDFRMKLAAALKAEAQRQAVAPPEVMQAHLWAGDEAIAPGNVQPSIRPPLGHPEERTPQ